MTSVTALRFDRWSGAVASDEARTWNPDELIFYTAEKFRPILPPEIVAETGLVALMGKTGTSTIQQEFIERVLESAESMWKERPKKGRFLSLEELARHVWDVDMRCKRHHLDMTLRARWGFETADLLQGFVMDGNEKIPLKDEAIVKEAHALITGEAKDPAVAGVFNNVQIVVGLDPTEGFGIYLLSLRAMSFDAVHEVFVTDGSGVLAVEPSLTRFVNERSLRERRGAIDPVEGVAAMLDALNEANELAVGVGGYHAFYLLDGRKKRPEERCRMIADARGRPRRRDRAGPPPRPDRRGGHEGTRGSALLRGGTLPRGAARSHGPSPGRPGPAARPPGLLARPELILLGHWTRIPPPCGVQQTSQLVGHPRAELSRFGGIQVTGIPRPKLTVPGGREPDCSRRANSIDEILLIERAQLSLELHHPVRCGWSENDHGDPALHPIGQSSLELLDALLVLSGFLVEVPRPRQLVLRVG